MMRKMFAATALMLVALLAGMFTSAPARAADVNLRGYWALDDGSGTTAADSSGYGYPGTLTGGNWSTSHAPTTFANTGSLSLDGSSGQGITTAAPVTTATNNVSLSAWVNWAGANGNYQSILYNGNSGNSGYGLFVDATGIVTILNGGIGFASSTLALTPGVWQYVVAMRDAGTWKLYVDGNLVALTGNPAPNTPASMTVIGRSAATTTDTFNGLIDEARVYDRVLASSETCSPAITVTNTNDSGAGSLRQAISGVCTGGTITFNGDYTILLASELAIGRNMTIDGVGHNVTVSGNHAVRVFDLTGGTITLNKLTIADGYFDAGFSGDSGAGIRVNGSTLNLTNATVSGNVTGWPGGGGIELRSGTANVSNSTFIGNSGNYGGGIDTSNSTTLNVSNSTFSGNHADSAGGGLSVGGVGNIINCTISGNSADWPGGGGGINNEDGAVTVSNSIIANNPTGGNCFDHYPTFSLIVGVNSLANDGSCGSGFTNSSSILLGALGNYGGSTQTFPLLPGSSAIDTGDDAICAAAPVNNLDQRGIARPQGAHCDVGACESQGFTLAISAGNNQHTQVNTAFTNALVVDIASSSGEPVNGGKITFTPPASGASASITGNPATISSGAASVSATANGIAGGPYLVNASAAGANSVDFSLTNDAPVSSTTTINVSSTTTVAPVSSTTTIDVSSTTTVAPVSSTTTIDVSSTTTVAPVSSTTTIDVSSTTTVEPVSSTTTIDVSSTTTIAPESSTTTIAVASTTTVAAVSTTTSIAAATTTSSAPVQTTTTVAAASTTTTVPVSEDCLTVMPKVVDKLLFSRQQSFTETNQEPGQDIDPAAFVILLKMAGYAIPLQVFVLTGDTDTEFARGDRPEWNTDSIQTLLKLRLGKRAMLALVFINPFTAEAGTYEVTIGDCGGTVELVEP